MTLSATPRNNRTVETWPLIALIATLSLFFGLQRGNADEQLKMSMRAKIEISNTGDADVDFRMQVPEQVYSAVKKQFGDAEYLGRLMNKSVAWSEIQNLKGRFIDDENTINATLTNVGYAKPFKKGKWVIDLSKEELTLLGFENNEAHLMAEMNSPPFGNVKMLCIIYLPEGSKNYDFDENKGRLFYDFDPPVGAGSDDDVDFEIDAKEKIMSSLAKIYGYEKFENFWVARSIFRNSGNQVITNLRVRHRINNMSTWSGWKKARVVYPGQTVIVPFFPVLDIDKVSGFTSTRNAMVEAEYSYEVDGEKVTDSDSTKIQILGRNEVEWSSCQINDAKNFYDLFDNCPQIFAAYTHENDPVVQQVAGTVCRMLDGIPPQTDELTLVYMKALWIFMEENRISYQLPPGSVVEGRMVQNLKFARDVIRIKAGTCADLSVFWASVCKAAGLETAVCCVPGHAFPAVILPQSKKIVPIESTFILKRSFNQALEQGMKTYKTNAEKGTIYQVKITDYRAEGVHCLDLPRVETDYLQRLDYKMNIQLVKKSNQSQSNQRSQSQTSNQQSRQESTQDSRRESRRESSQQAKVSRPRELCGTWKSQFAANGGTMVVVIALLENGECASLVRLYDSYGDIANEETDSGVWVGDAKAVYTKAKSDGKDYTYPYRFKNGSLILTIDGNEIALNKVKQ